MFEEEPDLLIVGPRQGEMSEKGRLELVSTKKAPLILIGAGSAVNFILDTLQYCCEQKPTRSKIALVYTTRDYHLYLWAMEAISWLLEPCEMLGHLLDVKIAFTGSLLEDSTERSLVNVDSSVRSIESLNKSVKTQAVRFDMYAEIAHGSTVSCQGSENLKDAVQSCCKKVGATFYGGRGGAREDLK